MKVVLSIFRRLSAQSPDTIVVVVFTLLYEKPPNLTRETPDGFLLTDKIVTMQYVTIKNN